MISVTCSKVRMYRKNSGIYNSGSVNFKFCDRHLDFKTETVEIDRLSERRTNNEINDLSILYNKESNIMARFNQSLNNRDKD